MSEPTFRAYIALGANLGNPLAQIDCASASLAEHADITRLAMSPVYQSVPHGDIEQPDYYNAVMSIETSLAPAALLAIMHDIEAANGRERNVRWASRTLDLDLILYDDLILSSETLTIPHLRAHEREFVVKPLYDLDKNIIIPQRGSVIDLLKLLPLENLLAVRHETLYK